MKKRFLIPAICVGGFLGMAALGHQMNNNDLAKCNDGELAACSEVLKHSQDQITNKEWLADKAKKETKGIHERWLSDCRKGNVYDCNRAAKSEVLTASQKEMAANKKKALEEKKAKEDAAAAKFKAEGWFQLSPGIYGRWCTKTCSTADVIGNASYWLMEVWAKDRAAGDIYAQINVLNGGTVIGWTNDTAYLSRGQKGVLTFSKYLPGYGSQYSAELVKFSARG